MRKDLLDMIHDTQGQACDIYTRSEECWQLTGIDRIYGNERYVYLSGEVKDGDHRVMVSLETVLEIIFYPVEESKLLSLV